MSRRNTQRKHGTTRRSPRRSRTAKAARINRPAAKSRCAGKWDGWGQVSVDGPGHYNPDRSEGPWGRVMHVTRMAVFHRAASCDTERRSSFRRGEHEGHRQTAHPDGHAGSRLNQRYARAGPA
jgi:hypothetical protein